MDKQRGQAMVYGLFILLMCSAALFFMFNVGQLSREKTKMVNTADAVAYSAGVLHARMLNLDAYTNRVQVANEILVAQMVSLSSWSGYLLNQIDNAPTRTPECSNYASAGVRYVEYAPLCIAYYYSGPYAEALGPVASLLPDALRAALVLIEAQKTAVKSVQQVMHSYAFEGFRFATMQEVADANYENDGTVKVDPFFYPLTTLKDDWHAFAKLYENSDRQRLKDLVVQATNKDDFVRQRNWTAISSLFPGCALLGNFSLNQVERRGGTHMNGLDEWVASDQAQERIFYIQTHRWRLPTCDNALSTLAAGEQSASAVTADGSASSKNWSNYTGLPSFYDLSNDFRSSGSLLSNPDPRMVFGVRLRRKKNDIRTTDGGSAPIRQLASSRIGNYETRVAKDTFSSEPVMAAVSTVEVYFERPSSQKKNTANGETEKASLFNPFWRVRLIDHQTNLNAMRAFQLISTP